MNSIIEAQITLKEEINKELERCKDPYYFFINYWKVNNVKIEGRDVDKASVTRLQFEKFKEGIIKDRSTWNISHKSTRRMLQLYPVTPLECFMTASVDSMDLLNKK